MGSAQEAIYNHSPVWLQNLLVSAYGYHLYRKRYTGVFHEIRALLREARSWNQQQVEDWQAERLHHMVRHCRLTVPYYRQLFAEHGLHENDFTSVPDVQKLPILTKATLRENNGAFRSSQGMPYMVQHTSGSTGTPLALEVDEYTYKLAMALLVDHEENHGVRFGASRATFAGRMVQPADRVRPPFARFNRAENQMLFSSYHLNQKTFPWYAKQLRRFKPQELIGYPSAISDLASYYLQTLTKPEFQPKAVITNSETLLDWQRDRIEKVFNCRVFDYYGTAEYVVFAGQEKNTRYRLNPIIGITELAPSQEAPASAEGRLIATTLTNHSMPLLRYEIGDTAIATDRYKSQSVVHELKGINGRLDDYVEMPDGRRIGRLDHVFKGIDALTEAQIVQDAHDHCTIYIVLSEPASDTILTKIQDNLRARLGDEMATSISQIDSIPRGPNGKFRNVVRVFDD